MATIQNVQIPYDVIEVDLATARASSDPERFELTENRLFFQYVPAPFYLRLGTRSAPRILIPAGTVGALEVCHEENRIGAIYIDNGADPGAGAAVILAGSIAPDFSGFEGTTGGVYEAAPSSVADGGSKPFLIDAEGRQVVRLGDRLDSALDSVAIEPGAAPVVADTELPTAAALSDALANPTAPLVGAAGVVWDPAAAAWRRARSASTREVLNQAALDATTDTGELRNPTGAGVMVAVVVSALTGTPTYTPRLYWRTGGGRVLVWEATAAITADGTYLYHLGPAGVGEAVEAAAVPVPDPFDLEVAVAGGDATNNATVAVYLAQLAR